MLKLRLVFACGLALAACGGSDEPEKNDREHEDAGPTGGEDQDGGADSDGGEGEEAGTGGDGSTQDAGSSTDGGSTSGMQSAADSLLFDWLPVGGAKEARVEQIVGSALSTTSAAFGRDGFVITAGVTNTAGYTLIGFKTSAANKTFESRVEQVTGSMLSATLESMGSAGFVPGVLLTNSAGYTVIGQHPTSSDATYDTRFEQIVGSQLSSTVENFGLQGFVLTAAVSNSAGYSLIGVRAKGDDTKFEGRVEQVTGASLGTTLENFALQGYVLTAAVTNSAGYTLIAQRAQGETRTLKTVVSQVVGSAMDATLKSFGSGGYVANAALYNTAGYTLFGVADDKAGALPKPPKGNLTINGAQRTLVDVECVYTQVTDILNVIGTLEGTDEDEVTLIFKGLPSPRSFSIARFPNESTAAGTVAIVATVGAQQYVADGSAGSVLYDDTTVDSFNVSGAAFVENPGTGPGFTVSGKLDCDTIRIK